MIVHVLKWIVIYFFSALELECDSVQSWQKNFSLHRTFAQPSLHFKQNFSGVVYAPIPFHLSLASQSLYDHKQEKVRGMQSA